MLRVIEIKIYHAEGRYLLSSLVLAYKDLDNIQLEQQARLYMKKHHPNTAYKWFIKQ